MIFLINISVCQKKVNSKIRDAESLVSSMCTTEVMAVPTCEGPYINKKVKRNIEKFGGSFESR